MDDIHIVSLSSVDGVALGAAAASSQVSVQVVVFFAVILHKVRLLWYRSFCNHTAESNDPSNTKIMGLIPSMD